MEKEIAFKEGLVSTPYSDVCPDGQLSAMHNVEVHAGSVRPSVLLGSKFMLNGVLKFIHKTGDYTHFIYIASEDDTTTPEIKRGMLCYYRKGDIDIVEKKGVILERKYAQKILNITNTGHVLTIVCEGKEIQYAIWEGDSYHYLGTIPELDIKFGLVLEENKGNARDWYVKMDDWESMGVESRFNKYSSVIGEYINTYNKKFVLPFFVRAAYRLYDKTYTKLTPPVLMMPNTDAPYITRETREEHVPGEEGLTEVIRFFPSSFIASLEYITNNIPQNWNKVITDVCIFISQINYFNYKYDEKIDRALRDPNDPNQVIRSVTQNYGYGRTDSTVTYQKASDSNIDGTAISIHLKNNSDIVSNIDTAIFKQLVRIPILNVKASDVIVFDENTTLETIEISGEELVDNDSGKDVVIPNGSFMYNKRLNIFNLLIKQYIGDVSERSVFKITGTGETCNLYVRLQRYGSNTEIIPLQKNASYALFNPIYYYYVHNSNAIGLIVEKNIGGVLKYDELHLEKSLGLNGCYYFNRSGYIPEFNNVSDFSVSENLFESKSNYIHTSKVENPFVFTKDGENVIGNGAIINLCTANKPLSEGQVGDFPVIAFCTDGNYALSVIRSGVSAGLYESPTPMKPDVAISKTIVATEEGILFVSNQGLMLMSRNETTLLSKKIDGVYDGFVGNLPSRHNAGTVNDVMDNGVIAYTVLPGTAGEWFKMCTAHLAKGNVYRIVLTCETLKGSRASDYYISIKEGDNVVLSNHKIEKYLETEWISLATDDTTDIYIQISFYASGSSKNHDIGFELLLVSDNTQNEEQEPEEPAGEIQYDDMFDVLVKERFEDYTSREFLKECVPVLDYTNRRIILIRCGFDKAYVLKYDEGAFSTIEFKNCIRTALNVYPFSYVQFEDNMVVVLDDDYNFDDAPEGGHEGLLVTRPMKLDSLLLKRINEFALEGNFSEKQRITVYGSNDLRNWHTIGTTERRHVGAMRGYYFKYWRFKIETRLKENENLSGIMVRYNTKNDGRFR